MFRKLQAIEIAEGALLADIAVLFQLLVTYMPVGSEFFRLLNFVVFAIIVLRRGLYVGIMSMLVTLFIVAVTVGPQATALLTLESLGGLFLGFTMRHHLRHIPLLLIGITGGAASLFFLILLSFALTGFAVDTIVRPIHDAYTIALSVSNQVALNLNLSAQWQHTFYPTINNVMTFFFTYWLLLFYLLLWLLLCPVVTAIYFATNFFVRVLGYDVRPFPGGLIDRLAQSSIRHFRVEARNREKSRFWIAHFIRKDIRRSARLCKKSFSFRRRRHIIPS